MITKESCREVREIVNKHLAAAAKEAGLTFSTIGNITFSGNMLRFKVELFTSEKAVEEVKEAKVDHAMLRIYGLTLGEETTCMNGKKYKVVGTYRNGFVLEDSDTGKKYRAKRDFVGRQVAGSTVIGRGFKAKQE
ncbi:MAG: hypothetical protein PHF86_03405 [Candidatus Nanoarchaeia archaeon]|jgi:hypothetical protein|nr:hypothetical protein [Candidatus Nanoarchaeia archaeon]